VFAARTQTRRQRQKRLQTESSGYESTAPADIEKRPVPKQRKLLHQFNNARVAMLKPKRLVFDLETLVVAFARIRNRLLLRGIRDAVGTKP
jgi:hypothetical protein